MTAKLDNSINAELANVYKNEFISLIRSRLGIDIHSNQSDVLISTIIKACDKFKCEPLHFLEMLKDDRGSASALDFVSANITIGETYFFRDKKQMKLLEEEVLPKIIKQKRDTGNYSIRVWSAGCSSGEEIYTIAMLLSEMLPDKSKWSVFLLGTDINTQQLSKAVKGVYSEWSMRSISSYHKNKYFEFDGNMYHLSSKIKSMPEFSYLNLIDDVYPSILNNTNAHDLIMCRNVLIYFDDDSIKKLLAKIGLSLSQIGYLLLGASDPVYIESKHLTRYPGCSSLLIRRPVECTAQAVSARNEKILSEEKNDEIEEIDQAPKYRNMKADKLERKSIEVKLEVNKAIELANAGNLQEAVNEFMNAIENEKTNKQLYLDLAMTLIELNRFIEAEDALQKAIFLDNKFVMAHFQLGMLRLRTRTKAEGIKCLNNALQIAKKQDPDAVVPGNPAMRYKKLAEILEKELLIFYD